MSRSLCSTHSEPHRPRSGTSWHRCHRKRPSAPKRINTQSVKQRRAGYENSTRTPPSSQFPKSGFSQKTWSTRFGQNFRSKRFGQNLLAPKPLTISINSKPQPSSPAQPSPPAPAPAPAPTPSPPQLPKSGFSQKTWSKLSVKTFGQNVFGTQTLNNFYKPLNPKH